MKKILFAVIFAYATVSFSACENKSTSEGEATDTTTVIPAETAPEEVTPADTTSTDTTSVN
ncbi:hypothetical protein GXP67_24610 [Rhodocytophaga rosea]|uniref:Entericidin n=1 Tax=Rhodocytophaga rosea TaxID=2704465 RepID=A0A6C0GPU1_9BACT|nr:hypothetical protein [Rhodocytophaga rosea]QHT69602.1 hypothetical protein GXP67_24610 [Rhodocytophaga rosea]